MAKSNLEKLVDKALALGVTAEELADATTEEQVKVLIDAKAPKEPTKKLFYYWVKVKSFINDSKTIEAGLYVSNSRQERLEKSSKEYVESFDGKVPEITLHKIAESYRITIFGKGSGDVRPYAEILTELVKEIN